MHVFLFCFPFSALCFSFLFFSVYDCLAFLYIPAFVLLHYLIRSFWDFFAYFHFVTFFIVQIKFGILIE